MSRHAVSRRLSGRRRLAAAKRETQRVRRSLRFETLEDRRLLATDPGLAFLQEAVDLSNRSPNPADLGQPAVYLYSDNWSGGTYGDIQASAMILDGNDPDAGHGVTSLRASWNGAGVNGWFQFWTGDGQLNRPRDIADFGLARAVRFLAKGDTAGQDIDVRVFKVLSGGGWQLVRNVAIDLATAWQDFAIDLAGLNLTPHDLHAVQFVIGDGANDGGRTFWLDEVRVSADGFDPLRVPLSYRAQYGDPASGHLGYRDGQIYPNRSFLYDSALTIKALLAAGDADSVPMALQVTDALLATRLADGSYANDRNGGHVLLADGTPRSPFSQKRTLGDQAWFGLALLDAYRETQAASYLERAIEISDWAENTLKDSGAWKGYRGGYDPAGNPYPWRSTEHNIDLFALNRGIAVLLALRGDARETTFVARATHAGDFVIRMFDDVEGKFWTGTGAGDTLNQTSVPLDAQTWSLLTLARFPQYAEQLDWRRVAAWVEEHLHVCDATRDPAVAPPLCGVTYSDQSTPGVVWLEGTAQAAVVAWLWREQAGYEYLVGELESARAAHPNGDGRGIVAASRDSLQDPLLGAIYDARLHVGATAWTYFATAGINPLLPQFEIPDQAGGMTFVVDDWNNKVTETDLGHNYFAGNSGAVESAPGTIETGLSGESSGVPGGSLAVAFDFAGTPEDSFAGVFTSLFGLTDTLVSLDGSGSEPAATTPFPGYYLDMTDVYRGFAGMADRSIESLQAKIKLLSGEPITVKIQLQDEAGFDVFTRRTISAPGNWESLTVSVPGGFDKSLAGHGNPAGFAWHRVSLCTLIVERENVGDGIANPDTGQFLVDDLKLVDADGSYPDVAAAADPSGLGLNPYFDESFLDLVRASSSQYFVDWASTDPRTGGIIQDRSTFADLMTVGGAGFQLTSYVVDARQGYLPRSDAAERVRDLLRVLADQPQGPERVGTIGYQGFFYHFVGIDGLRKQNFDFAATPEDESLNTVELSPIDTGLVLAGVVTAGQFFAGADEVEQEIRQLADEIYARIDFRFMLEPVSNQFYLGWKPNEARDDTGKWGRFLLDDASGTGQYSSKSDGGVEVPATLDFYTDEGLLLALLAMGSPNPEHRLSREVWDAMIRNRAGGDFVRSFPGALFTYEFANVWLDTNRLGPDLYPDPTSNVPPDPRDGTDFFANTQAAIGATRAYVEANPLARATWEDDARLWGLSAAEGPLDAYHAYAAPTAALGRHAGWLGTAYTLEAESGTGAGSIALRSNASNQRTSWLHSGEARNLTVDLPCAGTYELTVRYSNDNSGPLETVTVSVDGTPVGTFQAQDTGDSGAGWNVFVTTEPFGLWPAVWTGGSHQVTVSVSGGDGYGVEIDQLTLDLVRPLEDGTVTVYGAASAVEHDWFGATDALWRAAELNLLNPRFGYADAYNADVADAFQAEGICAPAYPPYLRNSGPWANFTGFAIDHGPLALVVDNYLSHNFVPELFMSQPHIQRALMTLFPDVAGDDPPLNPPSAKVNHLEEVSDDWGVYVEGAPTWDLGNVETPSRDGNALRLAVTGGEPYSNAYFYRRFEPESLADTFTVTFPFQISPASTCSNSPTPSVVQAIEFSMNTWVDSQRYEWAVQWENVGDGAPQWRYWDPSLPAAERWVEFESPISQCLAGEQWHILTLRGAIRNGSVYYESLQIDGLAGAHQLDITVPPVADPNTPAQMSIAVQLDGNSDESPYVVYLDEVTFTRADVFDYGDAPEPTYPTLQASAGARHLLGSGLQLGASADADLDGQPSPLATGDDADADGNDEDGVAFTTPIIPGRTAGLTVTASAAGFLNAWIDWNHDGDWSDAGEQVFTDRALAAGPNGLSLAVPADATLTTRANPTFARFRLNASGGLAFSGLATDGEVEDYAVRVQACTAVSSTADSGLGTLREALACANSQPGVQTVDFDIAGVGPHTIQLLSALPAITDAVVIDATMQPAFAGTPLVELVGSLAGAGVSGLRMMTGGNTVQGLAINGFAGSGIVLQTGGGNTIRGNFLGTNAAGTAAAANAASGIDVRTAGNTIGGAAAGQGNLISGNAQFGVLLGGAASETSILGNRIGTNQAGTAAVANGLYGIYVTSANNQIGGPAAGEGNLISGNTRGGVAITGATATGNVVQGNRIGTTADGTAALANGNAGVTVSSAPGNTLGGTAPGAGNVLSGNTLHGAMIVGATTINTLVQGNLVGLNAAGTAAVPNGQYGITNYAPNNLLGGPAAGAGNTVSGNNYSGVLVYTPTATGVKVQGNRIGTNSAGTAAVPNGFYGVYVNSTDNLIGGTAAGEGNQISGNTRGGVALTEKTAKRNTVQGNRIGTNPAGTAALANGGSGVTISEGSDNTIGGTSVGAGNQISGNGVHGVIVVGVNASGNAVCGNLIGLNPAGTAALPNGQYGVAVYSANTTIGAAGSGNTISGNLGGGVIVYGTTAAGAVLQGNRIGTDTTGSLAVPNGGAGVFLVASDSLVGGTGAGQGNTIAWNAGSGVYVAGAGSVRNAIRQNSLFKNGGWGIDVAPYGATANDPDDPDAGTNLGQNFPVLTAAVMSGENLNLTYSVPSATANSAYPLTVEFFLADADGQEGQTWLGSHSYAAPGVATASLAQCCIPLGVRVVATATDANGNTSEFSASRTVTAALAALAGAAGDASPTVALDAASLAPVVWQAIAGWESAGLDPTRVAALASVSFEIADLPGRYLAWASPDRIILDADAAGYGWNVAGIPDSGSPLSAPDPRLSIDLLTAVMHELGHVLGLPDLDDKDELMVGVLGPGARRLPTMDDVDRVHAMGSWLE